MENNNQLETVTLECRKRLSMTGVESVDGFSLQAINLTVNGQKVKISGEGIKITAFNKASGNFSAEGNFNEIKYNAKKQPLIKRIFK